MKKHRVVFEVNVDGAEQWQGMLNNVENLQKAFGRETTEIEVVASAAARSDLRGKPSLRG